VHPLEGNIYDMTEWVEGEEKFTNMFASPWVDFSLHWSGINEAVLEVPDDDDYGNKFIFDVVHDNHRKYFKHIGRLDDVIKLRNLPRNMQTEDVEKRFGEFESNTAGQGVVVCGSVGEVANKPELGHNFELSSRRGYDKKFDASPMISRQKHTVWALLALNAKDQLRQRVAWALSQILVVAPRDLGDSNTESSLQYYDIFVRNAFGSYRDILKQVSFSEKMSRMLSSVRNKSYQYNADQMKPAFPDEVRTLLFCCPFYEID
jgi:cullin-associated NEDD8-dissociated protein 1